MKITRDFVIQNLADSGLLFGDYVVLEKIGQGGMGVVLKAQHTRMERIVAVKKLTSAALESEDLVKRFYREVKAGRFYSHSLRGRIQASDALLRLLIARNLASVRPHRRALGDARPSERGWIVPKPVSDESLNFTLRAMDDSSADRGAGFTYNIDWDGDGTVDAAMVQLAGAWASQSDLEDVDGDGDLNMILHFRVQEMIDLEAAYINALVADLEDNGILDDNHQSVEVTLTGETTDGTTIQGTDVLDAFFAGKALRKVLATL